MENYHNNQSSGHNQNIGQMHNQQNNNINYNIRNSQQIDRDEMSIYLGKDYDQHDSMFSYINQQPGTSYSMDGSYNYYNSHMGMSLPMMDPYSFPYHQYPQYPPQYSGGQMRHYPQMQQHFGGPLQPVMHQGMSQQGMHQGISQQGTQQHGPQQPGLHQRIPQQGTSQHEIQQTGLHLGMPQQRAQHYGQQQSGLHVGMPQQGTQQYRQQQSGLHLEMYQQGTQQHGQQQSGSHLGIPQQRSQQKEMLQQGMPQGGTQKNGSQQSRSHLGMPLQGTQQYRQQQSGLHLGMHQQGSQQKEMPRQGIQQQEMPQQGTQQQGMPQQGTQQQGMPQQGTQQYGQQQSGSHLGISQQGSQQHGPPKSGSHQRTHQQGTSQHEIQQSGSHLGIPQQGSLQKEMPQQGMPQQGSQQHDSQKSGSHQVMPQRGTQQRKKQPQNSIQMTPKERQFLQSQRKPPVKVPDPLKVPVVPQNISLHQLLSERLHSKNHLVLDMEKHKISRQAPALFNKLKKNFSENYLLNHKAHQFYFNIVKPGYVVYPAQSACRRPDRHDKVGACAPKRDNNNCDSSQPSTSSIPQQMVQRNEPGPGSQTSSHLQEALAVDTDSNSESHTQLSGGAPSPPGSRPNLNLTHHDAPLTQQQPPHQQQQQMTSMMGIPGLSNMNQEMMIRQNGGHRNMNPLFRPSLLMAATHGSLYGYQHPGPGIMGLPIAPTTTAAGKAAEQTPKKAPTRRASSRQSQAAQAVEAAKAAETARILAQQQQQRQQQLMMQRYYMSEEERRKTMYIMNTTYPKGTKEPESLQRLPPIALHGPMSFPEPSHMMQQSVNNNSPPERNNQQEGNVQHHLLPQQQIDNIRNMPLVLDNDPDDQTVLELVRGDTGMGPATSLKEVLNRPSLQASTTVLRNDTEAVNMIHEITQSRAHYPRHDPYNFESFQPPLMGFDVEMTVQTGKAQEMSLESRALPSGTVGEPQMNTGLPPNTMNMGHPEGNVAPGPTAPHLKHSVPTRPYTVFASSTPSMDPLSYHSVGSNSKTGFGPSPVNQGAEPSSHNAFGHAQATVERSSYKTFGDIDSTGTTAVFPSFHLVGVPGTSHQSYENMTYFGQEVSSHQGTGPSYYTPLEPQTTTELICYDFANQPLFDLDADDLDDILGLTPSVVSESAAQQQHRPEIEQQRSNERQRQPEPELRSQQQYDCSVLSPFGNMESMPDFGSTTSLPVAQYHESMSDVRPLESMPDVQPVSSTFGVRPAESMPNLGPIHAEKYDDKPMSRPVVEVVPGVRTPEPRPLAFPGGSRPSVRPVQPKHDPRARAMAAMSSSQQTVSMPDVPTMSTAKPGPGIGKPGSMGRDKPKGKGKGKPSAKPKPRGKPDIYKRAPKPREKGKPRKSREGIEAARLVEENARLGELIMPMRAAAAAKINYREDDDETGGRTSSDEESSGSDTGKKRKAKKTPKKATNGRGRGGGRKPAKQISPVPVRTPTPPVSMQRPKRQTEQISQACVSTPSPSSPRPAVNSESRNTYGFGAKEQHTEGETQKASRSCEKAAPVVETETETKKLYQVAEKKPTKNVFVEEAIPSSSSSSVKEIQRISSNVEPEIEADEPSTSTGVGRTTFAPIKYNKTQRDLDLEPVKTPDVNRRSESPCSSPEPLHVDTDGNRISSFGSGGYNPSNSIQILTPDRYAPSDESDLSCVTRYEDHQAEEEERCREEEQRWEERRREGERRQEEEKRREEESRLEEQKRQEKQQRKEEKKKRKEQRKTEERERAEREEAERKEQERLEDERKRQAEERRRREQAEQEKRDKAKKEKRERSLSKKKIKGLTEEEKSKLHSIHHYAEGFKNRGEKTGDSSSQKYQKELETTTNRRQTKEAETRRLEVEEMRRKREEKERRKEEEARQIDKISHCGTKKYRQAEPEKPLLKEKKAVQQLIGQPAFLSSFTIPKKSKTAQAAAATPAEPAQAATLPGTSTVSPVAAPSITVEQAKPPVIVQQPEPPTIQVESAQLLPRKEQVTPIHRKEPEQTQGGYLGLLRTLESAGKSVSRPDFAEQARIYANRNMGQDVSPASALPSPQPFGSKAYARSSSAQNEGTFGFDKKSDVSPGAALLRRSEVSSSKQSFASPAFSGPRRTRWGSPVKDPQSQETPQRLPASRNLFQAAPSQGPPQVSPMGQRGASPHRNPKKTYGMEDRTRTFSQNSGRKDSSFNYRHDGRHGRNFLEPPKGEFGTRAKSGVGERARAVPEHTRIFGQNLTAKTPFQATSGRASIATSQPVKTMSEDVRPNRVKLIPSVEEERKKSQQPQREQMKPVTAKEQKTAVKRKDAPFEDPMARILKDMGVNDLEEKKKESQIEMPSARKPPPKEVKEMRSSNLSKQTPAIPLEPVKDLLPTRQLTITPMAVQNNHQLPQQFWIPPVFDPTQPPPTIPKFPPPQFGAPMLVPGAPEPFLAAPPAHFPIPPPQLRINLERSSINKPLREVTSSTEGPRESLFGSSQSQQEGQILFQQQDVGAYRPPLPQARIPPHKGSLPSSKPLEEQSAAEWIQRKEVEEQKKEEAARKLERANEEARKAREEEERRIAALDEEDRLAALAISSSPQLQEEEEDETPAMSYVRPPISAFPRGRFSYEPPGETNQHCVQEEVVEEREEGEIFTEDEEEEEPRKRTAETSLEIIVPQKAQALPALPIQEAIMEELEVIRTVAQESAVEKVDLPVLTHCHRLEPKAKKTVPNAVILELCDELQAIPSPEEATIEPETAIKTDPLGHLAIEQALEPLNLIEFFNDFEQPEELFSPVVEASSVQAKLRRDKDQPSVLQPSEIAMEGSFTVAEVPRTPQEIVLLSRTKELPFIEIKACVQFPEPVEDDDVIWEEDEVVEEVEALEVDEAPDEDQGAMADEFGEEFLRRKEPVVYEHEQQPEEESCDEAEDYSWQHINNVVDEIEVIAEEVILTEEEIVHNYLFADEENYVAFEETPEQIEPMARSIPEAAQFEEIDDLLAAPQSSVTADSAIDNDLVIPQHESVAEEQQPVQEPEVESNDIDGAAVYNEFFSNGSKVSTQEAAETPVVVVEYQPEPSTSQLVPQPEEKQLEGTAVKNVVIAPGPSLDQSNAEMFDGEGHRLMWQQASASPQSDVFGHQTEQNSSFDENWGLLDHSNVGGLTPISDRYQERQYMFSPPFMASTSSFMSPSYYHYFDPSLEFEGSPFERGQQSREQSFQEEPIAQTSAAVEDPHDISSLWPIENLEQEYESESSPETQQMQQANARPVHVEVATVYEGDNLEQEYDADELDDIFAAIPGSQQEFNELLDQGYQVATTSSNIAPAELSPQKELVPEPFTISGPAVEKTIEKVLEKPQPLALTSEEPVVFITAEQQLPVEEHATISLLAEAAHVVPLMITGPAEPLVAPDEGVAEVLVVEADSTQEDEPKVISTSHEEEAAVAVEVVITSAEDVHSLPVETVTRQEVEETIAYEPIVTEAPIEEEPIPVVVEPSQDIVSLVEDLLELIPPEPAVEDDVVVEESIAIEEPIKKEFAALMACEEIAIAVIDEKSEQQLAVLEEKEEVIVAVVESLIEEVIRTAPGEMDMILLPVDENPAKEKSTVTIIETEQATPLVIQESSLIDLPIEEIPAIVERESSPNVVPAKTTVEHVQQSETVVEEEAFAQLVVLEETVEAQAPEQVFVLEETLAEETSVALTKDEGSAPFVAPIGDVDEVLLAEEPAQAEEEGIISIATSAEQADEEISAIVPFAVEDLIAAVEEQEKTVAPVVYEEGLLEEAIIAEEICDVVLVQLELIPLAEEEDVIPEPIGVEEAPVTAPSLQDEILTEVTLKESETTQEHVELEEFGMLVHQLVAEVEAQQPLPPKLVELPKEKKRKVLFDFLDSDKEDEPVVVHRRATPPPPRRLELTQEDLDEMRRMEEQPRLPRRPNDVAGKRPKLQAPLPPMVEPPARKTRSASRSTVDEEDEYIPAPPPRGTRRSRRIAAEKAGVRITRRSRRRETTSDEEMAPVKQPSRRRRRRETGSDEEFIPPAPQEKQLREAKKVQSTSERSVSTDSESSVRRKTRSQSLRNLTVVSETSGWSTVKFSPSLVVELEKSVPQTTTKETLTEKHSVANQKLSLQPTKAQLEREVDDTFTQRRQKEATSYEERTLKSSQRKSKVEQLVCDKNIPMSEFKKSAYAETTSGAEMRKEHEAEVVPLHTITVPDEEKLTVLLRETREKTIRIRKILQKEQKEDLEVKESFILKKATEAASLDVQLTEASRRRQREKEVEQAAEEPVEKRKRAEALEKDVQLEGTLRSGKKRRQSSQHGNAAKKSKEGSLGSLSPLADKSQQLVWPLKEVAAFLVDEATFQKNLEDDVRRTVSFIVGKVLELELAVDVPAVEKIVEHPASVVSSCKKRVANKGARSADIMVSKPREPLTITVEDVLASRLCTPVAAPSATVLSSAEISPRKKTVTPPPVAVVEKPAAHEESVMEAALKKDGLAKPNTVEKLIVEEPSALKAVVTTKPQEPAQDAASLKDLVVSEAQETAAIAIEDAFSQLSSPSAAFSPDIEELPTAESSPHKESAASQPVAVAEDSATKSAAIKKAVASEPATVEEPIVEKPSVAAKPPIVLQDAATPQVHVNSEAQETVTVSLKDHLTSSLSSPISAYSPVVEDLLAAELSPKEITAESAVIEETVREEPAADRLIAVQSQPLEQSEVPSENIVSSVPTGAIASSQTNGGSSSTAVFPQGAYQYQYDQYANLYVMWNGQWYLCKKAAPTSRTKPQYPPLGGSSPQRLATSKPQERPAAPMEPEGTDFLRPGAAEFYSCRVFVEDEPSPVCKELLSAVAADRQPQPCPRNFALENKVAIEAHEVNPFPGVMYYGMDESIKIIVYVAGAIEGVNSHLLLTDLFFQKYEFGVLFCYEYGNLYRQPYLPQRSEEMVPIGEMFELYLQRVLEGKAKLTVPLRRKLGSDLLLTYCHPSEALLYTQLIDAMEDVHTIPVGVKLALLAKLDKFFEDASYDEDESALNITRKEKIAQFKIGNDESNRITLEYNGYVMPCPLAKWVPKEWEKAALRLYQLRIELYSLQFVVTLRAIVMKSPIPYKKKTAPLPCLSKLVRPADYLALYQNGGQEELEPNERVGPNKECQLFQYTKVQDNWFHNMWHHSKGVPFTYNWSVKQVALHQLEIRRNRQTC